MDWLLTVPLLLIEIILVMTLTPEESNKQCWRLGVLSALMILSGYKYGLVLSRVQSRRAGALGSRREGCEVALHRALEKDKSTLLILGIMIFIAACLYMRGLRGLLPRPGG